MRTNLLRVTVALLVAAAATTINAQNNCGYPNEEDVTWELNGSQLVFSGTGAIKEYSHDRPTDYPWFAHNEDIQMVIVGEGITSIPAWAFAMYMNLRSIHLPSTLKSIGWSCLEETNLWNVALPEGLETIEGYAFMMTPLISLSIPSTVTEIGERAFGYCDQLETVGCYAAVPPTLGDNAFGDCPAVATVYVQSAKVDAYKAAEGWGDFGDMIQSPAGQCGPDGGDDDGDDDVTKAAWTFDMATHTLTLSGTKLGQYNRPWNSTGMGGSGGGFNPDNNVGYPCGIYHLVIEEGIEVIPAMEFYMSLAIVDVTLPSTVTSIGMGAFGECFALESFTVNATTPPTLDDNVFMDLKTIPTIYVPAASVAAYKGAAGWSNYAEKIVAQGGGAPATTTTFAYTASEKVTKFDTYANFTGATGVVSHTFDSGAGTVVYEGTVTGLGLRALNSTKLTGITIPESVTAIGDRAFTDCTTLATITFEGTPAVTTIGDYALAGCDAMTSFTVPEGVTAIGEGAFQGSDELAAVTIPGSVASMGDYVFNNCRKLATVTFTGTPTLAAIGKRAFYDCESLEEIAIPASVAIIKSNAFQECKLLASVTFPGTSALTTIGTGAFEECLALKTIALPESVTTLGEIQVVGENTYYNNSIFWGAGLTSFVLPKNVTNIYGGAMFANCPMTSLTVDAANTKYDSRGGANAIFETANDKLVVGCVISTVPEGTKAIGREAFFAEEQTFSLTLPESVTSIEERAFHYATGLTDINIPSGVTVIPDETFPQCKLMELTIPDGVTKIGKMAYMMCTSLVKVTFGTGLTTIDEYAFDMCPNVTDVYCYADPFTTWSGTGFADSKATRFHVKDADAWSTAFPDANVTFVGDLETELAKITIGSAGVATYCGDIDLDFSSAEVKAYIATAFDGSEVTLTPIVQVSAGVGIIVRGAAGSYVIPKGTGSAADENMLVGTTTATPLSTVAGDKTNFILADDGTNGVGFYKVADGSTLAAHKAYLPLPTASLKGSGAIGIRFGDATSVGKNVNSNASEMKWFDLSGRKIDSTAAPAPGIYIVNGKKVIVK